MVQTDLTQLNRECISWREDLKEFRNNLMALRSSLQELIKKPIDKNLLPQVEHYENQIDIQENNINELKHQIKDHERKASWEIQLHSGVISDATWVVHEELLDRYEVMMHVLADLKEEFEVFLKKLS
ncbi:MAG: hypothetical protein ACO29O_02585 [Chitinophagaceae bacterium]